jgi:ABC-type antimicrobial peptide transport system permease subunit
MATIDSESDKAYTPGSMTVVVNTAVQPNTLVAPVRATIWDLDPNLPVANVRTVEQILSAARGRTAFTMTLLLIAACVALVLGTVGLYGVITYTVNQRIREFGVRMALGANHRDVTRMVVRQGLSLAALGIVFGVAGALGITRLLRTLLYGVSTSDPLTFGGVAALLLLIALLASYLPARRAAAVSPLEALRYE